MRLYNPKQNTFFTGTMSLAIFNHWNRWEIVETIHFRDRIGEARSRLEIHDFIQHIVLEERYEHDEMWLIETGLGTGHKTFSHVTCVPERAGYEEWAYVRTSPPVNVEEVPEVLR